jgi:hypothetical protein
MRATPRQPHQPRPPGGVRGGAAAGEQEAPVARCLPHVGGETRGKHDAGDDHGRDGEHRKPARDAFHRISVGIRDAPT